MIAVAAVLAAAVAALLVLAAGLCRAAGRPAPMPPLPFTPAEYVRMHADLEAPGRGEMP